MNDRSKFALSAVMLLTASQVPSAAIAQASGAASAASQPADSGVKVIDPTFFVAIGIALVIGFLLGRLTATKRAALQ